MKIDPSLIDMIKKVNPATVAQDIIGVQPMEAPAAALRDIIKRVNPKELPPPQKGDIMHCFIEGWKIFDGENWVPYRR